MHYIQINADTRILRNEVLNNTHSKALRRGLKEPVGIVRNIETISGRSYRLEEPYDEAAHDVLSNPPGRGQGSD